MTGLFTVSDFCSMSLNARIQICLVRMQFLELFGVKYFEMISNEETNPIILQPIFQLTFV